jgi:hypothetical protein
MGVRSFLQPVANELVELFEFIADFLGQQRARDALIEDLGGKPGQGGAAPVFPQERLDSVRAYATSADPPAEAHLAVLRDIAAIFDAFEAGISAWSGGALEVGEETTRALLDLLASNYVRLRWPRVFLFMQAVSAIDEISSTYGAGSNSFARVGRSFALIGRFLWEPGKTIAELDPERENVGLEVVDVVVRVGAAFLAVFESTKDVKYVSDILYGWDGPGVGSETPETPAGADLIAERMFTLAFAGESEEGEPPSEQGIVSIAMAPRAHSGVGVFITLGGSVERGIPLGKDWLVTIKAKGEGALAAVLGERVAFPAPSLEANAINMSVALSSVPEPDTGLSFALPGAKGTRLEIGRIVLAASLGTAQGEIKLQLADGAVIIDGGDNDGFISHLLGGAAMRLPFSFGFGHSSSKGLILEGDAPPLGSPSRPSTQPATPSATPRLADASAKSDLPALSSGGNSGGPAIEAAIPIGRSFGAIALHEVVLRLAREPADKPVKETSKFAVEAAASFSAQLGPVYARVERLGVRIAVDLSKPRDKANLRVIDLGFGIKPPQGLALEVDSDFVTGGGLLFHDEAQSLYAGALVLTLRSGLSLKAVGLVATRDPDGKKGFSLLIFITAGDFQPIPIGLGFTLRGIGGMLAINRTFDENAMRAALASGTLKNVLFPKDPLHHVTEVVASLTTLFPASRGSFLFGPLVKIGWGTPIMIDIELAFIIELGNRKRLIILGRLSSILPNRDVDLVRLNMDAVGVIDFHQGTAALDAVLVDSRFVHRFVLTGQMAMRMAWEGTPGFALAVGGMHPRFTLPAGFPKLQRISLALTTGDNPRLLCEAYFAITSNTLQFGARASLYAAALGFSIEGDVGFDVLIQFIPFHFLAEFHASVQLKRGSSNLFKVKVEGELEGPRPLRVAGKATFEILWCDFSVRFNKTLVDGGQPAQVEQVDALGELRRALGDVRNWQVHPPAAVGQLVSLRDRGGGDATFLLLHPLGELGVRQSIVPLNLARDIDRLGAAAPAGARRFAVTKAAVGPSNASIRNVREFFAPAQFFDMSDDEKIVAPSFEEMDAGVVLSDAGFAFSMADIAPSKFDFQDITIGPDGATVEEPERYRPSGHMVLAQALSGAAGRAKMRRTMTQRFAAEPREAPTLRASGWTSVAVNLEPGAAVAFTIPQPPPDGRRLTWIEAMGEARRARAVSQTARRVIVPAFELSMP